MNTTSQSVRLSGRAFSVEAMGFTGIAFALLASVAVVLMRGIPQWGSNPAELEKWFGVSGNRTRLLAMVLITLVACIALLWFIGAIRRRIGRGEDRLFATVFLGSGLILIAVMLTAIAAFAVPATLAQQLSPRAAADAYPISYGLGINLMTIVAPRVSAVFMLSLANLGRISGAFPKWLTALSTVAALFLLFAVTFSLHIAWILPTWCMVVGAVIIVYRRRFEQP